MVGEEIFCFESLWWGETRGTRACRTRDKQEEHRCKLIRFFFEKNNTFIYQGALNCSQVTVKTFMMLQKISNSCCSSELSIHQSILKNKMYHGFHKRYEAVQLFSTLITTRNVSWANQYIRMISEGSCDTEDWTNDAENSALITAINYILTYIHIENSYFTL